jgi:hypothetical protein
MSHVDEFIYDSFGKDAYARWVLLYFRLPAHLKGDFYEFMKDNKLFCTYEGRRYRVTGASRLGDIWLTSNPEREMGYELRVDVSGCSNWGRSF